KKELLKGAWDGLILSSREGNAIGRIWGGTLTALTQGVEEVRIGSEKLALGWDLLFKGERIATLVEYNLKLKKQWELTHGLLTEEQKLEEQRKISAKEYDKRQEALRTAEEEEKKRKAEAEEARKERAEAETKAFDDRIERMKTEYDLNVAYEKAMQAEDQVMADEEFERLMAEFEVEKLIGEEKKLFSDAMKADNLASIAEILDSQLAGHQKEWELIDKDKQKEQEKADLKKKLVNESFSVVSNTIGAIGGLWAAQKEKELSMVGDNAKAREAIEKKYAKKEQRIAIAKAIISGAQGIVKTGGNLGYPLAIPFQILQGIQTLMQIAVIKSQQFAAGGKVPGIGDKDTVPAMLTPGEGVINKKSMSSSDVMTLTGRPFDIASQLNSYRGFGIPFASGGVAAGVTNNTYNYNTMEKMQSDISDIKVVLNLNEVSAGLNELNVIQQTGEI
ncbi:MAG: hypothetical protein HQ541_18640, partial [Mariniphaga sp.]|nr:hypothetical protein [Mariniphaga sp.]